MSFTVAVITPFYNSSRFIANFVSMMKAQTFDSYRVYAINDNSTDNSLSLFQHLVDNDPHFLVLTLPKTYSFSIGPSSARNYALKLSSEPLVAFCDIDDIWHPSKLDLQVKYHLKYKLDLSFTPYYRFHLSNPSFLRLRRVPSSLTYRTLLFENPIPLLTVIISRSALRFMFPYCSHEDYSLWLALFQENPSLRARSLEKPLAFYCIHGSNITAKKYLMFIWVFQAFRHSNLSLIRSFFLTTRWSILQLLTLFYSISSFSSPHSNSSHYPDLLLLQSILASSRPPSEPS